jgi:hypothetical protein
MNDDGWKPSQGGQSWTMPAAGRWPANLVHDGSDEVLEAFAAFPTHSAGHARPAKRDGGKTGMWGMVGDGHRYGDAGGSPARFFYCGKASKADRGEGNTHPTVKPQSLMRWLCRLITPPGGTVLDPFAGSGSTLLAARAEGFHAVGIEREAEYVEIARRRLSVDAPLFSEVA